MPTPARHVAVGVIEVQAAIIARNTELLRRRAMGQLELERSAYLTLRALAHDGPADINTLAARLGLDASTVGRQVTGLAGDGLVERTPSADDRRRSIVAIRGDGRDRLAITEALRRERTTELLDDWSIADLEQFGDYLRRYNAAVASAYMTGLAPSD